MGTLTFTSSFIKNALQKDVRHVDLLSKMDDVQVAFGILICCFMQCPLYFLQCTPPSSTFIESFISFDSSFHKMFGCFLGPRSFDYLKGLLVHKKTSFPITFGGVGLILTSTITPLAYLGSWALVALVIIARFMVDQCFLSFLKP